MRYKKPCLEIDIVGMDEFGNLTVDYIDNHGIPFYPNNSNTINGEWYVIAGYRYNDFPNKIYYNHYLHIKGKFKLADKVILMDIKHAKEDNQ